MVTTMCHFVSPVYHPSFPRAATAMKMVACTPDTGCYWQRKQYRHCYAMLCYAKSLQSCPTLCDPIDGSLPGSPVPGILQARTLEWVAIAFSNAWKWKVKVTSLCRVRLLATPWTAAYQAPLSMGFSRQEYWSGVPLPSPNIDISLEELWLCVSTSLVAP